MRLLCLATLMISFLVVAVQCSHRGRESPLRELLEWHLARRQSVRAQDVYKLLYQGVFGPAHIVEDPQQAKQFLVKELQAVEPSLAESLLEPISTDGSVVRVNLRTYKARGGDVDLLCEVLKTSARQIQGQRQTFLTLWSEFVALTESGEIVFDANEVRALDRQIRETGPQVMHHSSEYRKANAPAYRVVSMDVFEKTIHLE